MSSIHFLEGDMARRKRGSEYVKITLLCEVEHCADAEKLKRVQAELLVDDHKRPYEYTIKTPDGLGHYRCAKGTIEDVEFEEVYPPRNPPPLAVAVKKQKGVSVGELG